MRTLYIRRVLRSAEAAPALNTATELILGAVSAALAQLFTTPVGVIATRQQIGSHEESHEDETIVGHVKDIYQRDGITGFWRGLKPSLVLTVNPAITYGVFERTFLSSHRHQVDHSGRFGQHDDSWQVFPDWRVV